MKTCPIHGLDLIPFTFKPRAPGVKPSTRFRCTATCCTVTWDGTPRTTPADKATRELRQRCHDAFDPLWQREDGPFWTPGKKGRKRAYHWMESALGLKPGCAHIGMLDYRRCLRLLAAIESCQSASPESRAACFFKTGATL